MTLPTFLVIGAQKSGTTSMHRYLQDHPDVYLPLWKEPAFFVEEQTWSRGVDWYRELFSDAGSAVAVGEASTAYTMFPYLEGVPARIKGLLPDVRLVYVVRDPIERMRSAFVHELSTGAQHRTLRQALLEHAPYLLLSQYALQIDQYLEHFDRAQLLVVFSSDLEQRPEATLDRVFEFIGVSPWTPSDLHVRHHRSGAKRAPRRAVRAAGGLMARAAHLAGRYIPGERRVTIDGRLLTRGIRPEETCIDEELRIRLRGMLAPDVRRLRGMLDPATDSSAIDAWGIG